MGDAPSAPSTPSADVICNHPHEILNWCKSCWQEQKQRLKTLKLDIENKIYLGESIEMEKKKNKEEKTPRFAWEIHRERERQTLISIRRKEAEQQKNNLSG